jgi:hypothetical protein
MSTTPPASWEGASLVGYGFFTSGGEPATPEGGKQFITVQIGDKGYKFELTGYALTAGLKDAWKEFTFKNHSDAFVFQFDSSAYILAQRVCQVSTPAGCFNTQFQTALFSGQPITGKQIKQLTGDNATPKVVKDWLTKYTEYSNADFEYRVRAEVREGLDKYKSSFTDDAKNALISGALNQITGWLTGLMRDTIRVTQSLVGDQGILGSSVVQREALQTPWALMRNLANIFFLLILLVIAFANVSRLNIEYYTMRSLIPKFVAAVVLVNLSFFIATIFIDVANVLTKAFLTLKVTQTPTDAFSALSSGGNFGDIVTGGIGVAASLFVIIFALVAALFLWLLLIVRVVMIWFLVIVSPLAFIANVLPATRSFSTSWWNQFIRFVFMAPLIALILKVGEAVITAGDALEGSTEGDTYLIPMLAAMTLLIAGLVPAMLGGKMMAAVGSKVRGAGAWAGRDMARRTGVPAALERAGRRRGDREALRGAGISQGLNTLTRGRLGQRDARMAEAINQAGKLDTSHLSQFEAEKVAQGKNLPWAVASARALAKQGKLKGRAGQEIFDRFSRQDGEFLTSARNNQPDYLLRSADSNVRAFGRSAIANGNIEKWAGFGGAAWNDTAFQNVLLTSLNAQKTIAGLYDAESNDKVRRGLTNEDFRGQLDTRIARLTALGPRRDEKQEQQLQDLTEARARIQDYTDGHYEYSPEPWKQAHGLAAAGAAPAPGGAPTPPTPGAPPSPGIIIPSPRRTRTDIPRPGTRPLYDEQVVNPDSLPPGARAPRPGDTTTSRAAPTPYVAPQPVNPSPSSTPYSPSAYEGPVNRDAAAPREDWNPVAPEDREVVWDNSSAPAPAAPLPAPSGPTIFTSGTPSSAPQSRTAGGHRTLTAESFTAARQATAGLKDERFRDARPAIQAALEGRPDYEALDPLGKLRAERDVFGGNTPDDSGATNE